MPRMLTTDEFISQAKKIHGNKFDYSKVNYTGDKNLVIIICKKHGEFTQIPNDHKRSKFCCPDCVLENNRLSTKEFIKQAREIHGDKFDYSLVEYKTGTDPVIIVCPVHGEFEIPPVQHKNSVAGCPRCGRERIAESHKLDTKEFIRRGMEYHNGKYDYSLSNYTGWKNKLTIICPFHGEFEQSPMDHLKTSGCKECGIEARARISRSNTNEFISDAIEIHGDKYDYSKVDYTISSEHVTIICPEHGEFEQTPAHHKGGQGCPHCASKSLGEDRVCEVLTELGVEFDREVSFDKCRNIYPLPFDFYFNYGNDKYLIEYDGRQHFSYENEWGGIEQFKKVKKRDKIKDKFAENSEYCLIRIPYWEYENVYSIICEEIGIS